MDKLSLEELRDAMQKLLEVLTCPVCLGTVRLEAVLCDNGHAVCKECKQKLNQCPSCQVPFSRVKPTLVNQVVEILPHPCRYECSEMVKPGDNHEKFCSYKPTECKVCFKSVRGLDIHNHIKEKHNLIQILKTDNIFMFGIEVGDCMILSHPNAPTVVKDIGCTLVNNQFFWIFLEKNLDKQLVYITFSCVLNEKPVHNWNARLELRSKESQFTMKIKLILEAKQEENSIAVPMCMLRYFLNEDNQVKFHIQISCSKFV